MEPSNRNQAQRRAARRRRAQQRRRMLWIMCGLLTVILVVLLAGIWVLLRTPKNTDPSLQNNSVNSSSQTGPSVTNPTDPTAPSVPVVTDEIPPEIQNASNRVFWVGDTVVYTGKYIRETDTERIEYLKVTATDDSGEVNLSVERDAVDPNTAGTYPVTYTATDAAGNVTSVTVQFSFLEKPSNYVDPEQVYEMAQDILDDITTEDMTDMEVAFAIYRWTKSNIGYVGSSDKSSWTGAAYQAFTERAGDCYNYFAAAKALFTVAGIENVDVVKSDTSHSSHYWSLINLGDGWYHVDCTPRRVVGYFFMNTDAELEAYSVKNKNSHIFDGSLYPERATESVQHRVDYANGKIKD